MDDLPGGQGVTGSPRASDAATRLHAALAADSRALLAFLERRVDVRDDAADLLGEVFLIAWRRVTRLPNEPERARMWLFVIARNCLLNYRRGRRRQVALASALRAELHGAPESPDTDLALDVRRAIDALSPELAELVRLVHWDGFSLSDAAELMAIPASTARSRYLRARGVLGTMLPAYT